MRIIMGQITALVINQNKRQNNGRVGFEGFPREGGQRLLPTSVDYLRHTFHCPVGGVDAKLLIDEESSSAF